MMCSTKSTGFFARLLGVSRATAWRPALAADARARPHEIADDQADRQREGRDDFEIDQRLDADPSDVGASLIWATPDTIVQKMIGAMTILMRLTKPSPSAFIQSLVANCGDSQPSSPPSTIADEHLHVEHPVPRFRRRAGAAVAVAAAMTFTPPVNGFAYSSGALRRQP